MPTFADLSLGQLCPESSGPPGSALLPCALELWRGRGALPGPLPLPVIMPHGRLLRGILGPAVWGRRRPPPLRGGGGTQLQRPRYLSGADRGSFLSGASTPQSPAQNPKGSKKGGKTSSSQSGRGSIPPGAPAGRPSGASPTRATADTCRGAPVSLPSPACQRAARAGRRFLRHDGAHGRGQTRRQMTVLQPDHCSELCLLLGLF